jgi:hypothetical protein
MSRKLRFKYGIMLGNATAFGVAFFIMFIMAVVFTSRISGMCNYSECESDVMAGRNPDNWSNEMDWCDVSCVTASSSSNPGPQSAACADCVCERLRDDCGYISSSMSVFWVMAGIYGVIFGVCVFFATRFNRQIRRILSGNY